MSETPAVRPTKAMVLAAGLGMRLRPLTELVPKPLVPVAGVPLVRYALKLLKFHGFEEAVVNLHHLPDAIEAELGHKAEGLKLHFSREEVILGTGGGLKKVAGFFDSTFVAINADALVDVDLTAAIATHRRLGAMATMVVMPKPRADGYSAVGVDEQGRIRQISGRPAYDGPALTPHTFTGVHVLEREFLDYIPPDVESCINAYAYPKVMEAGGVVAAHRFEGLWCDVGTLERLWQINADLLSQRAQLHFFDPLTAFTHTPRKDVDDVIRLGERVTLGANVRLIPPVMVGNNVRIGDGAEVGPYVVVGPGSHIGKRARVSHSLLLPGSRLRADTRLDAAAVVHKTVVPLPLER